MRRGYGVKQLLVAAVCMAGVGWLVSLPVRYLLYPPTCHPECRVSGRTPCNRHLRLIGRAILTYAADHDGYLPPSVDEPGTPARLYGLERLHAYLDDDALFRCPQDETQPDDPTRFEITGVDGQPVVCSYLVVADEEEPESGARWGVWSATTPVALDDIAVPSDTIMLVERAATSRQERLPPATVTSIGRGTATPTGGESADANLAATMRHMTGANYLFADGAVRWLPRSREETGNATGANATPHFSNARYYYFWRSGVENKELPEER